MKRFATLLLAMVLIASQINTHRHFINASLAAYYLYIIVVTGFTAFCAVWLLKRPVRDPQPAYSWPFVLYTLFTAYVVISSSLFTSFTYKTTYALAGLLFVIGLLIFINRVDNHHLKWIFNTIIALGVLQAGICLLQWLTVLPSTNRLFVVTGSWVNPNVTAMFLALSIPPLLYTLFERKGKLQGVLAAGLIMVVTALFLLKCRTALIGSGVAACILLTGKYQIAARFRTYSFFKRFTIVAGTIALFTLLTLWLYNTKKASTESRKLVWALSGRMITEKPLTGYGYGQFEKHYNLFQATYLAQLSGNTPLPEGAGYVNMAYNELLETTVEGGLPALLLEVCFGGCLLLFPWFSRKKKQSVATGAAPKETVQVPYQVAYAGVAAFITMSLVNFTFQAIPVYCVFLIYFVILSTNPVYNIRPLVRISIRWRQAMLKIAGIILIAGNGWLMFHWYKEALAQVLLKKVVIMAKRGSLTEAAKRMQLLHTSLSNAESFWRNYAYILLVSHKYQQAIQVLKKASAISADPDIHYALGYCYEQTGTWGQAIPEYQLAAHLEPQRLKPRYALMKLYYRSGDTLRLISMANQIIALPSKGNIEEANGYKTEASKLLHKIKNLSPADKVF
ncbi:MULTISPECIES: O-antigen ligase family protein [Niastella]|uniref:O-antigen ligase family protein n=1 Tax=Niastella soli TaxID=2821487 RepID=A0ABS3Z5E5_9BACT|nr:O-antigen ligase family protein [Niastella soli]MBO9205403.1 O-antigen ligase family protein [Niastella soli]